jgi:hypothetical protein
MGTKGPLEAEFAVMRVRSAEKRTKACRRRGGVAFDRARENRRSSITSRRFLLVNAHFIDSPRENALARRA